MPDRVTLRHVARRPFTGAWIETLDIALADRAISVAPSRGRGLKHAQLPPYLRQGSVAPSRGRGLKPPTKTASCNCTGSPLHGGVD